VVSQDTVQQLADSVKELTQVLSSLSVLKGDRRPEPGATTTVKTTQSKAPVPAWSQEDEDEVVMLFTCFFFCFFLGVWYCAYLYNQQRRRVMAQSVTTAAPAYHVCLHFHSTARVMEAVTDSVAEVNAVSAQNTAPLLLAPSTQPVPVA
jgi:hypothetical protein